MAWCRVGCCKSGTFHIPRAYESHRSVQMMCDLAWYMSSNIRTCIWVLCSSIHIRAHIPYPSSLQIIRKSTQNNACSNTFAIKLQEHIRSQAPSPCPYDLKKRLPIVSRKGPKNSHLNLNWARTSRSSPSSWGRARPPCGEANTNTHTHTHACTRT